MQTITQVLCSDCVLGCKVKNPKMLTRTTNIPTMCRGVTSTMYPLFSQFCLLSFSFEECIIRRRVNGVRLSELLCLRFMYLYGTICSVCLILKKPNRRKTPFIQYMQRARCSIHMQQQKRVKDLPKPHVPLQNICLNLRFSNGTF